MVEKWFDLLMILHWKKGDCNVVSKWFHSLKSEKLFVSGFTFHWANRKLVDKFPAISVLKISTARKIAEHIIVQLQPIQDKWPIYDLTPWFEDNRFIC